MAIITNINYKGLDIEDAYIKVHDYASVIKYVSLDARRANQVLDSEVITLSDDAKTAIYDILLSELYPDSKPHLEPLTEAEPKSDDDVKG